MSARGCWREPGSQGTSAACTAVTLPRAGARRPGLAPTSGSGPGPRARPRDAKAPGRPHACVPRGLGPRGAETAGTGEFGDSGAEDAAAGVARPGSAPSSPGQVASAPQGRTLRLSSVSSPLSRLRAPGGPREPGADLEQRRPVAGARPAVWGQHAARLSGVWEPCKPELLVSEDEEGPATRSGRGSRSQRGRVPPLRGVVPPLRGSAARREPAPREPGARPRGRLSCVARGLASPHQRREWGAECRGATTAGRRQPGRGQPGRGQPGRHLGTRRHRGPVRKRPSGRKPTRGPLVTAAGRARAVHKQPPEGVRNAMVLAPSCASASSLEEGFPGREPPSQRAWETPRVYAGIYTLGGFLCSCWFGHLDSDRPVKLSLNVQVSVSTPPPRPPIHAPTRRPPTCPSVQLTHASTCPRLLSGPIRSPAKQVQLP